MTGESVDRVALSHADRLWQAERENAERLAARVRFVVPTTTTLLGFVFTTTGLASPSFARSAGVFGKEFQILVLVVVGLLVLRCVAFLVASLSMMLFHVSGPAGSTLPPKGRNDLASPQNSGSPRPVPATENLKLSENGLSAIRQQLVDQPVHWRVFRHTYAAAVDLGEKNDRERQRIRLSEEKLGAGIKALAAILTIYLAVIVVSSMLEPKVAAVECKHEPKQQQAENNPGIIPPTQR